MLSPSCQLEGAFIKGMQTPLPYSGHAVNLLAKRLLPSTEPLVF